MATGRFAQIWPRKGTTLDGSRLSGVRGVTIGGECGNLCLLQAAGGFSSLEASRLQRTSCGRNKQIEFAGGRRTQDGRSIASATGSDTRSLDSNVRVGGRSKIDLNSRM